jgi:hypothetical protein
VTHEQTDVWVRPFFVRTDRTSTITQQAASLNFVGDLIEDAQAAAAKFVTQDHDLKAGQEVQFIYNNNTVRLQVYILWHA